VDLSGWDGWGPAHLNVCLDEPLIEPEESRHPPENSAAKPSGREKRHEPKRSGRSRTLTIRKPDVVLVGSLEHEEREPVRHFLEEVQRPVLAEATSGLREEPALDSWLLRDGEHSLRDERIRSVLRIGGVPSGRFWREPEDRTDIEVCSVLARGFRGLARDSLLVEDLEQLEFRETSGIDLLPGSRERGAKLDALLEHHPRSEPSLLRAVSDHIGFRAGIFLGNSLPIREWNLAASREAKGLDCRANRGTNGIDGNLSTWLGLTATEFRETWGIFGDLTTLYDGSAPWIRDQLEPARRRLVVLNNGGGRIFRRIPALASLEGLGRQVTDAEHETDFADWARFWGGEFVRWEDGPGLNGGDAEFVICEVRPDAAETESFWRAWDALSGSRA